MKRLIINADDFYGREAYRALGDHLTSPERAGEQCVIGYPLEGTLSEHGGVSRALLKTAEDDRLESDDPAELKVSLPDGLPRTPDR